MLGVTDMRFDGTLISFNRTYGYGSIFCEEFLGTFGEGVDAFVPRTHVGHFRIGKRVTFSVILNNYRPQAVHLAPP